MRDYYKEIDTALRRLEEGKYADKSIDWVIDRINWCFHWKKIGSDQMNELADRVIKYLEGDE